MSRTLLVESALAVCLAAAAAPPALHAQGFSEYLHQVEGPPAPIKDFHRVAAGDFDGDFRSDLAVLVNAAVGLQLAVTVAPQHLRIPAPPNWTANDISTVSHAVGSVRSRLLIASSDGLRESVFDDATGSMTNTVELGGLWLDSRRVVAERVGNDVLVVGLCRDGKTLLFASESGGSYTHLTHVTLPTPVEDLAVLDWLGDGTRRVAATTAGSGLLLVDSSGTIQTLETAASGTRIARLRDDEAHDKLCWLFLSGGTWTLRVHDKDGTETDVSLPLLTDPSGMSCADMTGNDTTDCAIAQATSYDAYVLERQGIAGLPSTHYFDAGQQIAVTMAGGVHPGSPADDAPAVFYDFDRDGRADLCQAQDSTQVIAIATGIDVQLPQGDPGILVEGVETGYGQSDVYEDYGWGTQQWVAELRIDANGHDDELDAVEVVGWYGTYDSVTDRWNMEAAPESRRFHFFHQDPSVNDEYRVYIRLSRNGYGEEWTDFRHYFFDVRFVDLDAENTVIKASESFVVGLTMQSIAQEDPATYMDALRNHTELLNDVEVEVQKQGKTRIGGARPPRVVPEPPPPPGGTVGNVTVDEGPPTATYY